MDFLTGSPRPEADPPADLAFGLAVLVVVA